MEIIIKNSSEVTAITRDGKLYPSNKGSISHPVSLPGYIIQNLNKGLYCKTLVDVKEIGVTQKGNPKFRVLFNDVEFFDPKDFTKVRQIFYRRNKTFLKTVEKVTVMENPYIDIPSTTETVMFSDIPEEEKKKLQAYRLEEIMKRLDQRLNTVYTIVTEKDQSTQIEYKHDGDSFKIHHYPRVTEWSSNFQSYNSYYPSGRTVVVHCKHGYYSDRTVGGNSQDAAKFFDIEKSEPYNVRTEIRSFVETFYEPESDDGMRRAFSSNKNVQKNARISNIKYIFRIKPEYKGYFAFDYHEIVFEIAEPI